MNTVLAVYKPQGITPFQLIQHLREKKPEFEQETIGYAGRLDPLAHGIVLLMIGEANKEREKYLNLEKRYEFSVLFGLTTDSYDYLGILKKHDYTAPPKDLEEKIKAFVLAHRGKIIQTYPPFSSKTINGKQLFKLAKKKKLDNDKLPQREVTITHFDYKGLEKLSAEQLQQPMLSNLRKIKGFFRQRKTIEQWKKYFQTYDTTQYHMAHFSLTCTSGTYVRSLANEMGELFGCHAIAYEILRTKVGDYTIDKAIRL